MSSSGPQPALPPSTAFTAVAEHYDLLMRDIPYRTWTHYVQRLVRRAGLKPRRVLDVACGTGNVTMLLAQAGMDAVGVDLSPGMIECAKQKAQAASVTIPYYVTDAALMELPEEPFDLCISLFDSLNYIIDPQSLRNAFAAVKRHLAPNGLFIFDVNSRFALESGFFDHEQLDPTAKLYYDWKSSYDAATRLCTVAMKFILLNEGTGSEDRFHETHVQYAYEEVELLEWLRDAGFTRVESFQAYTLNPVRPETDRIFFSALA